MNLFALSQSIVAAAAEFFTEEAAMARMYPDENNRYDDNDPENFFVEKAAIIATHTHKSLLPPKRFLSP